MAKFGYVATGVETYKQIDQSNTSFMISRLGIRERNAKDLIDSADKHDSLAILLQANQPSD